MSWARLDDRIAFHPKVIAAGDAAFGLWVRMVTHSCAHSTDGFISNETVRMFGAPKAMFEKLVKVRLLDRSKGGFLVHDFLDWNPSAEQAKAKQTEVIEKRRAAGRVGGRKSAEARKAAGNGTSDQANGQANGKQTAKHFACPDASTLLQQNPTPVPSRPVPSNENPPKPPQGGAGPAAHSQRLAAARAKLRRAS